MSRYCREGGAGSLERPCRRLGPGRTQQKDVGEQSQEGRQAGQPGPGQGQDGHPSKGKPTGLTMGQLENQDPKARGLSSEALKLPRGDGKWDTRLLTNPSHRQVLPQTSGRSSCRCPRKPQCQGLSLAEVRIWRRGEKLGEVDAENVPE